MQHTIPQQRNGAAIVVGLLLIAGGVAVLALQQAGVDVARIVGEAGWPVFVIAPGLILLVAAAVPRPPSGIGFAIAGSIVTAVGVVLWYQTQTGDWESWAYLWAAIPLAIGLAFLGYGSLTGDGRMVTAGLWVGGVAVLALGVGAWFFQGIFGTPATVWSSAWWSVLAIIVGAVITLRALLGPRDRT